MDYRNVLGLCFVALHDGESSPVADRSQFVLDQDRIEKIERLFFGQRIVAPNIHLAAHGCPRLYIDNEASRFAEVIQDLIQRGAAKVHPQQVRPVFGAYFRGFWCRN